jgi:quercetin dioxygenase-like cupin family protein
MTSGDPIRLAAEGAPDDARSEPSVRIHIDGAATAGRLALLEWVVARGEEPPRHCHHWEDEALFVLAGALSVQIGGTWVAARAGAAVFLPRGVEHGFLVATPVARLLVALTPAGFEGCYRELGGATAPTLERLVATAARYGCEITGPPPADGAGEQRERMAKGDGDGEAHQS